MLDAGWEEEGEDEDEGEGEDGCWMGDEYFFNFNLLTSRALKIM